jgi:hypothetical protein
VLDTRELRAELEDVPLNHPQVARLIHDNVESSLNEIMRG